MDPWVWFPLASVDEEGCSVCPRCRTYQNVLICRLHGEPLGRGTQVSMEDAPVWAAVASHSFLGDGYWGWTCGLSGPVCISLGRIYHVALQGGVCFPSVCSPLQTGPRSRLEQTLDECLWEEGRNLSPFFVSAFRSTLPPSPAPGPAQALVLEPGLGFLPSSLRTRRGSWLWRPQAMRLC